MENIINSFNYVNYFWEILTPLCFILADIITGLIGAFINKNVSSTKMREGLLHKLILIIILFLGVILENAFNAKFITIGISFYIVFMEWLSILENASKSGLDLKIINDFLEKGENKK